jgi:preprotein translocase subunit YajC
MVNAAWAMGAGEQAGGGGEGGGGLGGLLAGPLPMLILMFVIFYFLLIRPQQKKAKQHREMLSSLNKGDQVVTAGGLYGKITGLQDQVVVMEIAPQVRVKVNRASISAKSGPGEAPAQPQQKK